MSTRSFSVKGNGTRTVHGAGGIVGNLPAISTSRPATHNPTVRAATPTFDTYDTGVDYEIANEERRARIRRDIDDKPLMNYKFAYCPDCGQQVRVNTTRDRTFAVPHPGCPYGHLYREAEYDHDRMCAEIIIGDDEGAPLNGYIALWREERVEVYAETTFAAQQAAIEELKPVAGRRKVHPSDVTVVLAEKNGATVTHATAGF